MRRPALAVATGRRDILNLAVTKGRVVYLAIENPHDTVSRFAIAQHFRRIHNFDLRDRLFIVTVKATPESVFAALEKLSPSGAFALVIVDTLAAYFDGTDMNDNVAAGEFMRRLRALSTVLGHPAVVVLAHPTKGAEKDRSSPTAPARSSTKSTGI
jgi:RecA-family ATPase